ncbi:MAG: hypothetical protein ACRDJL_11720 [Actinomycetota bacterium]
MSIDLRRASSSREVSGARPKVERSGGPADLLNSRVGRLAGVGVAVLLLGLVVATLAVGTGEEPKATGGPGKSNRPSAPAATDLANYAFLLPELKGLPPSTAPGTVIEIWATWEPPVTKKLKVQQLIPRATVTKMFPSIEPGPPTVMLELERRFIPDLMYGDRFGTLSTVIVARPD